MPTSPSLRRVLAVTATAGLVAGLAGTSGTASAAPADPSARLAPRTSFVMAPDGSTGTTAEGADIPNIDSVKSTIRTYYNAEDGIADKTSSPYISEITKLLTDRAAALPAAAPGQAIVLDADDTTLWTYDMEDAAMGFNFDPALQNTYVQEQRFPATPGMVAFVQVARAKGYQIVGLTGRNDDQKAATIANLDKYYPAGAFDASRYFTKYTGKGTSQKPAYLTCAAAPTCTTVEYKAGTRKYVETPDDPATTDVKEGLGLDIVLNIGDQWSDLQGGYADATLKLPNPTYYLPSADLPGLSEPTLAPRTVFSMQPDGSSGLTAGGEGIPNIDSVKATVRAYYHATSAGIADKTTSPYITEMKALTRTWAKQVRTSCRPVRGKARPAVVLDVDDTTLWGYDFEDAGVHFDFDPVLQDVYVHQKKFTAVPGMKKVVKAAQKSGCTVVGLTGRSTTQKGATFKNLKTYYGTAFSKKLLFTKWTGKGKDKQPAYVSCKVKNACTTIEYKSQTRKHLETPRRQGGLGLRVVANIGDQFSDLKGGHSRLELKVPNPTYYLP